MKKTISFLFLALFLFQAQAQDKKINWMSLEEAISAQKDAPKKIIMDVYTDWCGPCKMLDKNTFQNPDVVKYVNEHFYAVKFNAEGDEMIRYKQMDFGNPDYDPSRTGRNAQHELAQALGISAYPTIVFFSENGDTIMPLKGYKTPNQLELYLKLFNNDDYKNISTQEQWDKYQSQFVFQFKG